MRELVHSEITGKDYDIKDAVRIINVQQAIWYMQSRVLPMDIYVSRDFNNGRNILVFIFSKKETRDLYNEWLAKRPDGGQIEG